MGHSPEALELVNEAERLRASAVTAEDWREVTALLAKAFDLGIAEAGLSLGQTLATELGDSAGALSWYKKACDAGSALACITVGQVYAFGLLGQDVNQKLAEKYLDCAAKRRDSFGGPSPRNESDS